MNYKTFFSTLAILVSAASGLRAQSPSVPAPETAPMNNIIKISPFHFIESTFLMSYERMLNQQRSSIMIMAGLHSRERSWDNSQQFGFQEEVQYRAYVARPTHKPDRFFQFKGLYAGPYIYHRYRDELVDSWDWILQQNISVRQRINEISGGVIIGTQISMADRLFIDFWTGGGVKRSFGERSENAFVDITQVGFNGVLPKIGFQIGIGF